MMKPATGPRFVIGSLCEACWSEDGVWYRARIDKQSQEGIHVTFVDYGNTETVPPASIRPLPGYPSPIEPPPPAGPKPGDACEAMWSEDGVWYQATILKEVEPGVFHVLFPEYGNEDVVPRNHLRPIAANVVKQNVPKPKIWQIGEMCQAKWSEDGEFYIARIVSVVVPAERFLVTFVEYGNQDKVHVNDLRPLEPTQTSKPPPVAAPAAVVAPAVVVAAQPPPVSAPAPGFRVGELLEAKWSEDGIWYKARIDKIDARGMFSVTFVEYGNTDTVPASSLRPQTPLWKIGQTCEAKWTEDQIWYRAVIDAISPSGNYDVTFVEYGNTDKVKVDSLRPLPQAQPKAQAVAPSPSSASTGNPASAPSSQQGNRNSAPKGKPTSVPLSSLRSNEGDLPVLPRGPRSSEPSKPVSTGRYQTNAPASSRGPPASTPQTQPPPQQRPVSAPPAATQPQASNHIWVPGSLCEAKSKVDSTWYRAKIVDPNPSGTVFLVRFDDFGGEEYLSLSEIRPPPIEASSSFDLGFTANLQIDRFMKKLYPDREPEPTPPPPPKVNLNEVPLSNAAPDRKPDLSRRSEATDLFGPKPLLRNESQRRKITDTEVPLDLSEEPQDTPVHMNHHSSELPIAQHHAKILSCINHNQVVIISGSTGSGKTTQVPQYILDEAKAANQRCRIVCTQPRRIAAISIARRVCEERHQSVGAEVGYQVSMDKKGDDNTLLTYVTTGLLLQKLVGSKSLDPFTHIIIDEVHERDTDTDFVLLILRELVRQNKKIKVILMSATIDCELFAEYFSSLPDDRFDFRVPTQKIPILSVEGRLYQVKINYLDKLDGGRYLKALPPHALAGQLMTNPEIRPDMYEAAVELVERICDNEFAEGKINHDQPGSILMFLPGLGEITDLHELLQQRNDSNAKKLIILPLHSTLNSEEQQRVFQKPKAGYRKIIVATNIAESSITVPDVKYVIDFCLVKEVYCDAITGLEGLRMQWASRASGLQRSGRAGRVQNGTCFRMVPQNFWDREINSQVVPEIQRTSLDHVILQVKVLRVGDPRKILGFAMQPPSIKVIEESLMALVETGALSSEKTGFVSNFAGQREYDETGKLTKLGKIYAQLPVDIRIARLIVFGFVFDLPHEAMIMGACLSLPGLGVFSRPFQRDFEFFQKKMEWAAGSWSDPIAALRAYETWKFMTETGRITGKSEKDWARKEFLNSQKLNEARNVVLDLQNRLEQAGIPVPKRKNEDIERKWTGGNIDFKKMFDRSQSDLLLLKFILCAAFYPRYLVSQPVDKRSMEFSTESGFNNALNYNPWRTICLKWVKNLPQGFERHAASYFRRCGGVKKYFTEGAKCYVEFVPENSEQDRYTTDQEGNIQIPDIPLAITLAIKCWGMERRRFRNPRDFNPASFDLDVRDPKSFIGGMELEYPFQLRYQKILEGQSVKLQGDSVNGISLAKDPAVASEYLLVSPFITTSHNSEQLSASQTTLIEGRPLISALICMLFTHSEVEIFTNLSGTRYAGAKIGSKFELEFTASFSEGDLVQVNQIRQMLQDLISDKIFQREALRESSLQMKRSILELVTKLRKPISVSTNSFREKWKQAVWGEEEWEETAAEVDPWTEPEPTAEQTAAAATSNNPHARTGASVDLETKRLFPTITAKTLVPAGDNDDGSDHRRLEDGSHLETTIDRLANTFKAGIQGPMIACRHCLSEICPLSAITPFVGGSNVGAEPYFKILDCPGMSFPGMRKDVVCRQGHTVGAMEQGVKTINSTSNICVLLDDKQKIPWGTKVWSQFL